MVSLVNPFDKCHHSNLSSDFLLVFEVVCTVPDVIILKRGYIFMYVQYFEKKKTHLLIADPEIPLIILYH